MSQDIYKDIELFAEKLGESGHKRFAEDIRNAVASGSIGSEILGLVSLELKRAKQVLPGAEEHLVETADRILTQINRILG